MQTWNYATIVYDGQPPYGTPPLTAEFLGRLYFVKKVCRIDS